MINAGRKPEPPKQVDDKAAQPTVPPRVDEDDVDDGDICTPKRDHDGNDDEPL